MHPNLSIMRLDQHQHLEDGISLKYKKGFNNPKPQSVPPSKCSAWESLYEILNCLVS